MTERKLYQAEAVVAGEDRVRINITFTAKNGFQLNDSTVETTAPAEDAVATRNRRRRLMREAFIDGQAEALYRNMNPAGQDMPDDVPDL